MQVARSGGVILQSKSLVLSVKNLSVGYKDALVSEINLDLHAGEVIAVVGPSGIGKTTILRTVAGLVKPISGKIDCNTPRRGGIGYIPQKLGLVRHTSVYHNVDIGARSGARLFPEPTTWFKRRHERVLNAIDRMGLRDKISEPVRRLSGGQQRRVATARTLAQKPKLILADEFLSELDDDNISIVLDAVREYMVESESAMIIVEHNIQRASEISDRLLKVEEGKLVDFKMNETTIGLEADSDDEVVP